MLCLGPSLCYSLKVKKYSFSVSEQLHGDLKQAASGQKKTVSQYCREALEERFGGVGKDFLDDYPWAAELAGEGTAGFSIFDSTERELFGDLSVSKQWGRGLTEEHGVVPLEDPQSLRKTNFRFDLRQSETSHAPGRMKMKLKFRLTRAAEPSPGPKNFDADRWLNEVWA